MASRKKITERSNPFTTVNLSLPFKISVCGNREMQKKWKKFFNNKKSPSKEDFIMQNFIRDSGAASVEEMFSDIDSRRWDKEKMKDLLNELNHPNIQHYLNFILDRAIEENEKNNKTKG